MFDVQHIYTDTYVRTYIHTYTHVVFDDMDIYVHACIHTSYIHTYMQFIDDKRHGQGTYKCGYILDVCIGTVL